MAHVQKFIAKGIYVFANDAGGTVTTALSDSPTIPNNAVLLNCNTLVTTALTAASGTPTVAFSAGGVTMVAAQNFSHASLADEKVTMNDVSDKTTSATAIQIVIASAALAAGVIEVYVEYYISPESA